MRFSSILLIILLTISYAAYPQYILNGSATQNSCNCYTITPKAQFQNGSVWNANKIDLTRSFDFSFNVFLGCDDLGADGIVFILQPLSTSIGNAGEGMGFQGVSPSIGISLDTYQNASQNDPAFDHISIQANGNINHNADLAGPVPASATSNNIEDCQWHVLRIRWDATSQWLRTYFDNSLRLEKQINLVTSIFGNDPMVFWGFSGATGGQVNLQQFCTALNPDFTTNFSNDAGCVSSTFQFSDGSVSFTSVSSYTWDFGNGMASNSSLPPPQQYAAPGTYQVRLKIRGLDGCEKDTVKTITIGSVPKANFTVADACLKQVPQLSTGSTGVGLQETWWLDGQLIANDTRPDLAKLSAGNHQLELRSSSLFSCGADASKMQSFTIRPIPVLSINKLVNCKSVQFSAGQVNGSTPVSNWHWRFGDGGQSSAQNPMYVYNTFGTYTTKLWAVSNEACSSDTLETVTKIDAPRVFAGNDTVVLLNIPFQLHGSGNGKISWSPAALVSDANIYNPTVTLDADQRFTVTITTAENCVAMDDVYIKVMKGPAVYMPTAFTPNGDGRNDVLRPTYVGVQLKKFFIYNRWGQLVFQTSANKEGWNGKYKGMEQAGTFVWLVEASDYLGKPIFQKGTVTIIR